MTSIKTIMLAALAGLSLMAAFASDAFAAEFIAAEYPASLQGENTGESHVFTVEGVPISCASATLSGELVKASEVVTLTPAFSKCTTSESLGVTVQANGCAFVFHSGEEEAENLLNGSMDVTCPTEKSIAFQIGSSKECEIQVGAQSGLKNVTYENDPESGPESQPASITVNSGITGFAYTKAKDGAGCLLKGTGGGKESAYKGTALVIGSVGEEVIAIDDGAASITVPTKVDIANKDEKKEFPIVNSGTVRWEVKQVSVTGGTGSFVPDENCPGVVRAPTAACWEKVKCTALGGSTIVVKYTYGEVYIAVKCG